MSVPAKDLRDACVDEALSIIGEVGVEGLSIREVARRLGVSHQAPYKHFASSDHLLAEVARRTYVLFAEHLASRPAGRNPAESMMHLGQAYFQFAMEKPLHYRLMFGTPLPDPAKHPEMMHEARAAFSILLEALALARGGADAKLDPLDALFVWSTLHGLSSILKTQALEQLGLGPEVLNQALPQALKRIGQGLSIPAPESGI